MALPDQSVLLLHNARCSKSQATLKLLTESGIDFEQRYYLEDPLTLEELRDLRQRLGRPAREWIRHTDAAAMELSTGEESPEDQLLGAMAEFPKLMERPIVVRGSRARVGRPPAAVLELFQDD